MDSNPRFRLEIPAPWTPKKFAYVRADPINAYDPDGLDACYVSFPDMPIEYAPGKTSTRLGGHAGVLGYDADGHTRYYEYGRYSPNSSGTFGAKLPADDGNFRRFGVPDFEMGPDGKPMPKSMQKMKNLLSKMAGKGTRTELTCEPDIDEKKVYEYARKRQSP